MATFCPLTLSVYFTHGQFKSQNRNFVMISLYGLGYEKLRIPLGLIDKTWLYPIPWIMFSKLYDRGKQLVKWVHGKVKVI